LSGNFVFFPSQKTTLILKSFYHILEREAGTDEAGRGCLAGPVTAAAVILPKSFSHELLNDSKLLSHKSRDFLKPLIESGCTAFGVAHVHPQKIDDINILNAALLAMHKAIDRLMIVPEFIIVDGNRFKSYKEIPHECIVKGDSKYMSIAAASVLAKTYRDAYMEKLHEEYPMYNWEKNKGYPTKEHREAIRRYGLTPHHRLSFRQLPDRP